MTFAFRISAPVLKVLDGRRLNPGIVLLRVHHNKQVLVGFGSDDAADEVAHFDFLHLR